MKPVLCCSWLRDRLPPAKPVDWALRVICWFQSEFWKVLLPPPQYNRRSPLHGRLQRSSSWKHQRANHLYPSNKVKVKTNVDCALQKCSSWTRCVHVSIKNVLQFWLSYIRKMIQFHVLDLIYWYTMLDQIRLWADIDRNCNTFFRPAST